MVFKGFEIDFDIYDADTAESYENALKSIKAMTGKKPGESNGDCIRRQCACVFNFFDALFGSGFHKQLFGDKTNLLECLTVFKEFNDAVKQQHTAVDALAAEMKSDNITALNREQHRTVVKTKRVEE